MLSYSDQEKIIGAIVDIISAMNPHIEKVVIKRDEDTREFDIRITLDHCPECDDEN